ncbi:hypothetical protein Y032_0187g1099 [Ancylostoma ceylanicum]|uniref:Uncharacterized protein n=1 Tax=Ancylostoma ceylanicum TaxID=53326 RepID=A0A016SRF6_9BILA|nr:hypothetical protein Y032_0187g1099 [Ancylostoma ceylanicum]
MRPLQAGRDKDLCFSSKLPQRTLARILDRYALKLPIEEPAPLRAAQLQDEPLMFILLMYVEGAKNQHPRCVVCLCFKT